MVSLLGSLGSLSRTWSKSQGATDGSNQPLTSCSQGWQTPSPTPGACWKAGRWPFPRWLLQFLPLGQSHLEPALLGVPPRPRSPCRPAPTLPGPRQLPGSWESVGEAPHTFQELDLIHSCLRVMPSTLHYFQSHEALAPATPRPESAASPGQTHGDNVVAPTKPKGRIPAGTGPQGAKGTLTGCPSRARRWRSGPSPACAPHGTAH